MKNKALLFSSLICLLADTSYAAVEEKKQYVSSELTESIKFLNADTFFSSPSGLSTDYHVLARHYQNLADKVCQQIGEKYENDLKNLKDNEDVYAFSNEITNAFEAAGAYTLPIQIEGKQFQAEYYNPNWNKSANPDVLGGNEDTYKAYEGKKYKGDKPGKVAFNPFGLIVVKSELDRNKYSGFSPLNEGISDFHLWMTRDHSFETKNFNLKYDLVQPYLFVFHQNQADLNNEQIFLYVDIPYSIHSDSFGASPMIELSSRKQSLKCYAVSSSLAKSVGGFEEFKTGQKSNSLLVSLAPLTVPLRAGYQKKNENSAYPIKKEIIASPSLQCFMALQGLDTVDVTECSSQEYGEKFFKLLNEEVCVKSDKNVKAPPVNDIYYYYSWGTKPSYLNDNLEARDAACKPLKK